MSSVRLDLRSRPISLICRVCPAGRASRCPGRSRCSVPASARVAVAVAGPAGAGVAVRAVVAGVSGSAAAVARGLPCAGGPAFALAGPLAPAFPFPSSPEPPLPLPLPPEFPLSGRAAGGVDGVSGAFPRALPGLGSRVWVAAASLDRAVSRALSRAVPRGVGSSWPPPAAGARVAGASTDVAAGAVSAGDLGAGGILRHRVWLGLGVCVGVGAGAFRSPPRTAPARSLGGHDRNRALRRRPRRRGRTAGDLREVSGEGVAVAAARSTLVLARAGPRRYLGLHRNDRRPAARERDAGEQLGRRPTQQRRQERRRAGGG